MSLKAFVDSVWFKGLARGAMIVGAGVAGYVGMTLSIVNTRVGDLEKSVSSATGSNGTISDIQTDVTEIQQDVDRVRTDMVSVKLDLATVRGILSEMNRRDLAAETATPFRNLVMPTATIGD